MKGHSSADPPTLQKRCVNPSFFRNMFNGSFTITCVSISQIAIMPYLHAMWSCEFSVVHGERKTLIISLGCIRFSRKDNPTITHSDDDIFPALAVSLTLKKQNNGEKEERTAQDKLLNPVPQLASLFHSLRNLPDSSDSTTVWTCIENDNELKYSNQKQALSHLRSTAAVIGKDLLGLLSKDIGTKSIRSSTTMGWYLAGKSHPSVQLMGRWKSEA